MVEVWALFLFSTFVGDAYAQFVPGSTSCIDQFPDGAFSFPNICYETYEAGASINVTWTTTYEHSNLFYSQYGNDPNSVSIASNQAQNYWIWVLPTAGLPSNLSDPFHLHIVDANGDQEQQYDGGFWSPGFFIGAPSADTTSPAAVTTVVNEQVSTFTSVASSATSSSIASSQITGSNPRTTGSSISTVSTSTSPHASAGASTSPADSSSTSSYSSTVALGVGLGVGIPVLLALLGVLACLGFRRHKRANQSEFGVISGNGLAINHMDNKSGFYSVGSSTRTMTRKYELPNTPKRHELYDHQSDLPFEMGS